MSGKTRQTGAVAVGSPQHYRWWFPGSPIVVHLDLDVVERLQAQLREEGPDATRQGLLSGRYSAKTTEIHDFQPTTGRGLAEAANAPRDRLVVGYYRIETGGTLRLQAEDLTLLETAFPKPYQVFLLIQPAGFGPASATFLFHTSGARIPDVALLEFPFDAALLAIEEQQRLERSLQPTREQAVAISTPPAALPEPRPLRNRPRRVVLWMLFAATLVAGILAGGWFFRDRIDGGLTALRREPVAATRDRPRAVPSMGLHARRQNGDLELTWNRESPAIASATAGEIAIQDGDLNHRIALDSSQLRGGSVLYVPLNDNIQIRLTAITGEISAAESVLVLLPKGKAPLTQPLEESVPAAPIPRPPRRIRAFTAPSAPERPSNSPAVTFDEPPTPTLTTNSPPVISSLGASPIPPSPGPSPSAVAPPNQPPASAVTFQRPVAITKVQPAFPSSLRSAVSRPINVDVRVVIDKTGRVIKAEPVSPKTGIQFFTAVAVRAARLWRFQPARRGTEPVESEMVLQFVFRQ